MNTTNTFFQRVAYRSAEQLFRFAAPTHAAVQGETSLTRTIASFTARERRYLQPKRLLTPAEKRNRSVVSSMPMPSIVALSAVAHA